MLAAGSPFLVRGWRSHASRSVCLAAVSAGLWRCTWFGRSPKILHQGRAGGKSVAGKFEQLVELGFIDVTPSERDAKMSLAFAKRASGDPEKSGEVPWLESPETFGDVYWRRATGVENLFAEFAIFRDVGSLSKFNYCEVQLVGELPNTQFFMVSSSHGTMR